MDIQSVVIGGGPVASLIVLRTADNSEGQEPLQLPIRIGTVEASSISMGVEPHPRSRPMTHDLLKSTISALGATCRSVRIVSVHNATFFAQVELVDSGGRQVLVDARPSDAISLAVREHVAIYAEESVLSCAALPDFRGVERVEAQRELNEFHEFVENLSPDDFAF